MSASTPAMMPSSATRPWYSKASSRLIPLSKVLDNSSASSKLDAAARHRSLVSNHGNPQLATSCPAASAITWLLADEPRLWNVARYFWCA